MRSILRPSTRRRDRRQLRAIILIAVAFTIPALAASMSQAVVPPVPVSVKTLDDGNGKIDKIQIVFNTPMNTQLTPKISNGGSPGFLVEDYTISGFAWPGSQTLDILLVEKTTPDTGVEPIVSYSAPDGDVKNSVDGTELANDGDLDATDGAGPVLISVSAKDLSPVASPGLFRENGETMAFTFSEETKLAGANKTDRASNFERAIKFENVPAEGGTCPIDGPAASQQFLVDTNFPTPQANATSTDIFTAGQPPVNGFSQVFTVVKNATHSNSTKFVPAVPVGCVVGVDPTDANRAFLTDAANNVAQKMTLPTGSPQKIRIQPMDVDLASARTRDLRGGGTDGTLRNGALDAVDLFFPYNLDADTLDQPFTVSLNGVTATVTSKALVPGAPSQLRLSYTLPASATWDTAARPLVSYSKPSGCTGTQGTGLKADIGAGYRACIATFSNHEALDGAGPILTDAITADQNIDGDVDAIELTFNEAVADTPDRMVGWTVDGSAPATFQVSTTDPRRVTIGFSGTGTGGGLVSLTYASPANGQHGTMDTAAQQIAPVSRTARDGAAPRILDVTQYDVNGDGAVDRALVQYSESIIDPSTGTTFSIGGRPGGIASSPDGTEDPNATNDQFLLLAVTGLTGTDPKELVYTPGASPIRDAASNAVIGQTVDAADVVDAAAPRGTLTITPSAPMSTGESHVIVTYTEAMDEALAPSISFTTETGTKDVTAVGWNEAGTAWEGTVSIVQTDCTVPTGCPVTVGADDAQDPAGNVQGSVATLGTEIDTMAPAAPTLGGFAAHFAGRQAPANTFNMFTDGFTLGGTFAPAEAAGGRLELLVDGEVLDPAAISGVIGDSAAEATAATAFADAAALQESIAVPLDGTVTLTLQLCDDAANCAPSATGLDITVDYTPVDVSLSSPAGGEELQPGATQPITWDADEIDSQFQSVELRFSTNGGTSYQPIVSDLAADGTHGWTVPFANTSQARVAAVSIDTNGNEGIAESGNFSITIDPTFADVPASYWAFESIEKIYAAGITSGCGSQPLKYCPGAKVTRAQMAVFLLNAMQHADHLPAYRGMFSDVPAGAWYARYVEHLADHGITGGCGTGRFCPNSYVTRAQIAVFLLRATDHGDHLPEYQGTFADVPQTTWYRPWVEHLYQHGITGGCSQDPLKYCPGGSVTRAQMAVFMANAWNL